MSIFRSVAVALAAAIIAGCASVPTSTQEREAFSREAQASREAWLKTDPGMEALVKKSHGFVFFPNVAKAGFLVGAGAGEGVVYEGGRPIGYAEMNQLSAGALVGAQRFSQLVVFENKAAMDRFKAGELSFGANASAVIATTGTAASAEFNDGVAVFVRPIEGIMADASLGGQRILFIPR
jgi:lipid-binding SYLF domain-containing protein